MEPKLYGLEKSNRQGKDLWGKNQFNTTFPASLCAIMRDKKIPAVYLKINEDLKVEASEITIDELFNTNTPNNKLTFNFESKYEPYQKYAFDDIKGIDLIIKDGNEWCRPLEIKLTVIPDSSTYQDDEENWGTEIVIRPATTSYCALGIIDSCSSDLAQIREIFEPICSNIQHWDSKIEINTKREELLFAINKFQKNYFQNQKPFLLQPIWKTKGKSPILDKNAFDIFVWSDFAVCRLFLDKSKSGKTVDRYMRSSARLAKILFEVSTTKKRILRGFTLKWLLGIKATKNLLYQEKLREII